MGKLYLSRQEIEELINQARDLGLAAERDALLSGIDRAYVQTLSHVTSPLSQLVSDLHALNQVERLVDGAVPLLQWLRNACNLRGHLPEAQLLKKYREKLANASLYPVDDGDRSSMPKIEQLRSPSIPDSSNEIAPTPANVRSSDERLSSPTPTPPPVNMIAPSAGPSSIPDARPPLLVPVPANSSPQSERLSSVPTPTPPPTETTETSGEDAKVVVPLKTFPWREAAVAVAAVVASVGIAIVLFREVPVDRRPTIEASAVPSEKAPPPPPPPPVPTPTTTSKPSESGCPSTMVLVEEGVLPVDPPKGVPIVRNVPRFCIDKTEISTASYAGCVKFGKCTEPLPNDKVLVLETSVQETFCNWDQKSEASDHPINCVTWQQATTYCRSQGARLPTNAEWTQATRNKEARDLKALFYVPWADNGDNTDEHKKAVIGNKPCWSGIGTPRTAWRTPIRTCSLHDRTDDVTKDVGVQHMVGNLAEWTSDPYGDIDNKEKVVKGGHWRAKTPSSDHLGANEISKFKESEARDYIGFRCAKDF